MFEVSTPKRRNSPIGVRDGALLRKDSDVSGRQAELCQGSGNVGFTASKGGYQLWALQKSLKIGRGKPQHDLAEGDSDVPHRGLSGTAAIAGKNKGAGASDKRACPAV